MIGFNACRIQKMIKLQKDWEKYIMIFVIFTQIKGNEYTEACRIYYGNLKVHTKFLPVNVKVGDHFEEAKV
jgi:hypothetical protein